MINAQQNGLGVIRSIASSKYSLPIYAADHARTAAFCSRHLSGKFVLPAVFDSGFIPQLVLIGERLAGQHGGKSLLCPVNDEYVLLFSKHWEQLEPWFVPMFTTDTETLSSCVDKNRIYVLAEKAKIPFPRTALSLDEFLANGYQFPAVIKPLVRRSPEAIKKGVFRIAFCDNETEARKPVSFLDEVNEGYVIQEYIDGEDDQLYTAGIASWHGQILATYSGRKIRQYPPSTGVAALAETVFAPKVVEYGERILAVGDYSGIAQVEFKKSGDEYYLMEINPRPWMWNSLSTASGINLVESFLDHIFESPDSVMRTAADQKNGAMWMSVVNDLIHNVIRNRKVGVWRWLSDLGRSRCKSYWTISDPLPGITSTCSLIMKSVLRKFR